MVQHNGEMALARDFGIRSHAEEHYRRRFLAIDPGDEHVGLAEFECKVDEVWYCRWAGEMNPNEFLPWFVEGLQQARWGHVVVESWRLFPESAAYYVGSDMPTSRLIGAIAALAAFLPPTSDWLDEPVVVTLQSPQIKVPTRSILKRRKLRSIAKVLRVSGDHASDAELHGFKYLVDHELAIETVVQQDRRITGEHGPLTPSHDLW